MGHKVERAVNSRSGLVVAVNLMPEEDESTRMIQKVWELGE